VPHRHRARGDCGAWCADSRCTDSTRGSAIWQEQFVAAVDSVFDYLVDDGSDLAQHTWGERNTQGISS